MSLPLKKTEALRSLAWVLKELLPGSGNPTWRNHVTFATVASRVGVGEFWPGGSKWDAVYTLLCLTFEHRPNRFETLVVEIVRAGVAYRGKRKEPFSTHELDLINGHLLGMGFRFPDLADPGFRQSLTGTAESRAQAAVQRAQMDEVLRRRTNQQELDALKRELEDLAILPDRSKAGRQLESLLARLFNLSELESRSSFRVIGEEIDGSFELDHSVFLVEAKWQQAPVAHSDLLIFDGKIGGKSPFTRGVFIAMNDVSSEAREAIRLGRRPSFFVMNGYDLMMILSGAADLVAYLRSRRRLLDEKGRVFVPFSEVL